MSVSLKKVNSDIIFTALETAEPRDNEDVSLNYEMYSYKFN